MLDTEAEHVVQVLGSTSTTTASNSSSSSKEEVPRQSAFSIFDQHRAQVTSKNTTPRKPKKAPNFKNKKAEVEFVPNENDEHDIGVLQELFGSNVAIDIDIFTQEQLRDEMQIRDEKILRLKDRS